MTYARLFRNMACSAAAIAWLCPLSVQAGDIEFFSVDWTTHWVDNSSSGPGNDISYSVVSFLEGTNIASASLLNITQGISRDYVLEDGEWTLKTLGTSQDLATNFGNGDYRLSVSYGDTTPTDSYDFTVNQTAFFHVLGAPPNFTSITDGDLVPTDIVATWDSGGTTNVDLHLIEWGRWDESAQEWLSDEFETNDLSVNSFDFGGLDNDPADNHELLIEKIHIFSGSDGTDPLGVFGLGRTETTVNVDDFGFVLAFAENSFVEFSVAPAPLAPGDVDGDGDVDADDFGVVAYHNQVGGFSRDQGDLNDDGWVDIADFGILAFNFGAGPPVSAAVPEPASLALLGLGALAVLRRRRI